jgi:hypothetical protein
LMSWAASEAVDYGSRRHALRAYFLASEAPVIAIRGLLLADVLAAESQYTCAHGPASGVLLESDTPSASPAHGRSHPIGSGCGQRSPSVVVWARTPEPGDVNTRRKLGPTWVKTPKASPTGTKSRGAKSFVFSECYSQVIHSWVMAWKRS